MINSAMNGRRPEIQGLRAVAVLVVVAFHAGLPVPGGFIGVDVFFVISGFVITNMLHREWSLTGRIRFRQFYLRRFKRLAPALALMISIVMVGTALILSPFGSQQDTAMTAIGAMLFVANFVIARTTGGYFDAPAETNPLLNTWSLSVEEQFYFLFPVLLALGWYLSRRGRLLRLSPYVIVGGIAGLSFGLAVAGSFGLAFQGSGLILGFYSPLTRAWEFAAGALLALVLARRAPQSPLVLAGSGILGLLLLAVGLWTITDATPFPGLWTLIPVTAALLLILGGANAAAPTSRLLSTRSMVKVGDWSYSIYLWHWPMIVFATILWPESPIFTLIAALLSLAPAIASYHFVEQPMRSLAITGRAKSVALVAAVTLPTIAIAGSVSLVATHYWNPVFTAGQSQHQGDIGHDEFHGFVQANFFPCTPDVIRDQAHYWGDFPRCHQSHPTGPVEVALVGDSHAEHLFVGLAEAFPDTNIAYYILGDLPVRSSSEGMAQIIDYVAEDRNIKTVILAAYWKLRGVPVDDLRATLRAFRDEGKTVLVTDDVPDFLFHPVQCKFRKAPVIASSECTEDAASHRAAYDAYIGDLRRLVKSVSGVTLLETYKYFCSLEICSMTSGQDLLYRDPNHLNLNGTRFIAQRLKASTGLAKAMATL